MRDARPSDADVALARPRVTLRRLRLEAAAAAYTATPPRALTRPRAPKSVPRKRTVRSAAPTFVFEYWGELGWEGPRNGRYSPSPAD